MPEPSKIQLALQTLRQRQSLPLGAKVRMSLLRIRRWYEYWDGMVCVAFSGGKDSTVLLHLVRSLYPEVPAVFCDTGLEYPEIRLFVKTFDNVVWLKPKLPFREVLNKYGYPVIAKEVAQKVEEICNTKNTRFLLSRLYGDSKGNGKLASKWRFLIKAPFKISHRCCQVMKKAPSKAYEKETGNKPFLGTMAEDSRGRQTQYLRRGGCNGFSDKRPTSTPLSFWLTKDIWAYLKTEGIRYSNIYDMGYDRTGCMFCMFGAHLENYPNRFQRMQKTHPKQWKFCMEQLGLCEVLDYIGVPWKCPTAFWDWTEEQKLGGKPDE